MLQDLAMMMALLHSATIRLADFYVP